MMIKQKDNLLLTLSAKKVALTLSGATILMMLVHSVLLIAQNIFNWDDRYAILARINMDIEVSIPTWFATIILFCCSLLLWLIAGLERRRQSKHTTKWRILALMLLYMSLDEGGGLHELATLPIREILGLEGGYFYFSWIIPYTIITLLVVIYFYRFWLTLAPRIKVLFVLGAFVFVAGAICVEMLGAHYMSSIGSYGDNIYIILVALEEGMEKIGAIIFLYALLLYLEQMKLSYRLKVEA